MSWISAAANVIGGLFGLGGNIYQANQSNKWNQKQLDAQIAENQKTVISITLRLRLLVTSRPSLPVRCSIKRTDTTLCLTR